MAELDRIVCILIDVTGKYKSSISVKFFEDIKAKNGKRIRNKSMLTHLTPPVTLLLYTVASEATPLNPNRTKPSLID